MSEEVLNACDGQTIFADMPLHELFQLTVCKTFNYPNIRT